MFLILGFKESNNGELEQNMIKSTGIDASAKRCIHKT